jgi:hypothetical protein
MDTDQRTPTNNPKVLSSPKASLSGPKASLRGPELPRSTSERGDCGACAAVNISDFVVGSADFPTPKTKGLGRMPQNVTGGAEFGNLPPKSRRRFALAAIIVVAIVVIAFVAMVVTMRRRLNRRANRSPFWTLHAQEEPTRAYATYTGEVPNGEWGARPWALAMEDPVRRSCARAGKAVNSPHYRANSDADSQYEPTRTYLDL